MSNTLERVVKLRNDIDRFKEEIAKGAGKIEALTEDLKSAHGCDTTAAASRLLSDKQNDLYMLEQKADKKLAAFLKKWGKALERYDEATEDSD